MKARGRRQVSLKRTLIAPFGGKCERCGYERSLRALQFHHRDPTEKKEWSKGRGGVSADEVEAHPERFVLLCANCHFEEHERMDRAKAVFATCQRCGKVFESEHCRLRLGRDKYCSARCHHDHRMQTAGLNLEPRLWKYIEVSGDCWRWTGYMIGHARGQKSPALTTKNPDGTYSPKSAARLMYEIRMGQNPPGRLRRNCSTPGCVNPEHQRVLTH